LAHDDEEGERERERERREKEREKGERGDWARGGTQPIEIAVGAR
jgi:hypothetical protein